MGSVGAARASGGASSSTTPKVESTAVDTKEVANRLIIYKNGTKNIDTRIAINALRDAKNEVMASEAGIQKTLNAAASSEGVFNSDFNDEAVRTRILNVLNRMAPNTYEFRRVAVGKDKRIIPGFTFAGMPVKGTVFQWRLFKKS